MSKWEMVRLGDVCEVITKGTTPTTLGYRFQDEGINFLKVESIEQNGNFLFDKIEHISKECDEKLKRSRLKEHDLVFSIAGALGRTAIVTKAILPANLNQALSVIRLHKDQAFHRYIQYVLKSVCVFQQFQKQKQGVAQLNLSLKNISDLVIPLPPFEVQKQIAQTLDVASELTALHNKQLAELDKLIKSTFYDMFGDPVANEKGWGVKKLGEVGELARGISKHRPRNDPKLLNGAYPLIQTGDVANAGLYINNYKQTYSEIGLQQSKIWNKGTLCITIAANIAKTSILNFSACFPDSIVGFKPNESTNVFYINVWFSFFQKIIEEQAPESAQKNINLKILNDLDIVIPPIALQNQFAEIVTKIEEQKALVKKAIDESQYLFDSLMSEYFE